MEKGPEIRIIGKASAEKKEQAKKEIEQAFFNHFESLSPQEQGQLEKLEYPKSAKELALINFANEETSQLMQEAGIEPYDVSEKNLHIIPPEFYKKVVSDSTTAVTFNTKQGILFNAQYFRDNPVNFGAVALHEILHLKAHLSIEVQEEGKKVEKTSYREGVSVKALQKHGYHGKYHEHFAGLHEAIVAETEKRLLAKLFDRPELAAEKEWLMSIEAKEMKKKLAEEKEIPEDDIIWVGKKGEDDWEVVSYPQQRNVLNYVCTEIQKQFPEQFQNPDEVYKVFLNAHFTGRILPIGRLIEKTFGEGNFRILGNMDTDKKSGVLHLEYLKKARGRKMREKTEFYKSGKETKLKVKIEIRPGLDGFVPEEFRQNPVEYFESRGQNIKSGEIKRDETGRVREDPTAVKELPVWSDPNGQELRTIGKRVNIEKGKIGESGDPFYEYKIMEIVTNVGLPAPRLVAKVEQQGTHLIIMEKVQGVGWYEKDALKLKKTGCTDEDIKNLKTQAEIMMTELQQRFEEAGIVRGWKLKDMIFDIDIENMRINKIIPVDWERTKIDAEKLEAYRRKIQI